MEETASPLARTEDSSASSKRKRGANKGSNSPLMTRVEVEAYLGVSRWTLRRMEQGKNAKLHPVWVRGCKFYQKAEIYALAIPKTKE